MALDFSSALDGAFNLGGDLGDLHQTVEDKYVTPVSLPNAHEAWLPCTYLDKLWTRVDLALSQETSCHFTEQRARGNRSEDQGCGRTPTTGRNSTILRKCWATGAEAARTTCTKAKIL